MNKLSLLAALIFSLAIVLAAGLIGLSGRYSFHVQPPVVWRFDRLTGKIEAVTLHGSLPFGMPAQSTVPSNRPTSQQKADEHFDKTGPPTLKDQLNALDKVFGIPTPSR